MTYKRSKENLHRVNRRLVICVTSLEEATGLPPMYLAVMGTTELQKGLDKKQTKDRLYGRLRDGKICTKDK